MLRLLLSNLITNVYKKTAEKSAVFSFEQEGNMNYWKIIVYAMMLYIGYNALKALVNSVRHLVKVLISKREIEQIRNQQVLPINLRNMEPRKLSYTNAILSCVVTGVVAAGVTFYNLFNKNYVIAIVFLIFMVSMITELVICVLVKRMGDVCYLTPEGIVTPDTIFDRKCKFVINVEMNGPYEYRFVNVYVRKQSYPYRFMIIEREQEVLWLINSFM